ncbi:MAG: MFS transporter [Candidatus Rokubacteria bacterium]|nr:MFS transporter [Candidatus Rokubacteria bacterium]
MIADNPAGRVLALACVLTFLHYTGAYMRVPILPLYASLHGATPTDVGLIVGAHTALAALSAIPFGYAADRWGRRALLLGGMTLSAATSLLLPLVEGPLALAAIYGAAGLGVAAFTPALMSLVGDVAAPGTIARAYAWYTTALFTAFGLGPILGGWVTGLGGHRAAFVVAGAIIATALALGAPLPETGARRGRGARAAAFDELRRNRRVWAVWIATIAGLAPSGAILTFFPLLGRERGFTPLVIGLILGVLSFANTIVRLPAGWLLDRTRARRPWIVGGLLLAALGTALVPHLRAPGDFLVLGAALGVVLAVTFVAIGAALGEATGPATRGLALGGYSTAIYTGFGLASVGLGPLVTHWGWAPAFALIGGATALGALVAAVVWDASSGSV